MYAIIETGGKQYWVIPGETIQVERLEAKEGDKLTLKALWAAEEGGDGKKEPASTQKGTVTAEVVRHLRGPKIIVFKKKHKARYVRKIGHRQDLTEIRIKDISLN
jgi:large subunit ribosomal protein L21